MASAASWKSAFLSIYWFTHDGPRTFQCQDLACPRQDSTHNPGSSHSSFCLRRAGIAIWKQRMDLSAAAAACMLHGGCTACWYCLQLMEARRSHHPIVTLGMCCCLCQGALKSVACVQYDPLQKGCRTVGSLRIAGDDMYWAMAQ
jgi:hypothetical protein